MINICINNNTANLKKQIELEKQVKSLFQTIKLSLAHILANKTIGLEFKNEDGIVLNTVQHSENAVLISKLIDSHELTVSQAIELVSQYTDSDSMKEKCNCLIKAITDLENLKNPNSNSNITVA